MPTDTAVVIRNLMRRLDLSVAELAQRIDCSENTVRNWLNGRTITEDSQRRVTRSLGYENWGQLEAFVVPAGEVFALQHYAPDLECIWRHYVAARAQPIFETKIALSLGFGFPRDLNLTLRAAVANGDVTLHRMEQPREVRRLAELAANAHYFGDSEHYVLRLVPPLKQKQLFAYPNFIRFGKKALVLGRMHKFGAPGANDPVVLMTGDAAETLGDHLENTLWNDANAMRFSTEPESQRLAACKQLARAIAGAAGPHAFAREYEALIATRAAMESIRV